MNGKVILYLMGKILYFLGVVFAVPMLLGFGYQDDGGKIFAVCMIASFLIGFLFQKLGTKITEQYNLTNREGILTVVSTWLIAVCFSAVPFLAAGMLGPVDAFFEAMSGLTTTGATVLPDIEIWPRSLLFWRVWMHWIGGLGIIVIFIALLPRISGGGFCPACRRRRRPCSRFISLSQDARRFCFCSAAWTCMTQWFTPFQR